MKKITFLLSLLLVSNWMSAQTLNESANWPNPQWEITGTYNADSDAFEADPRVTSSFAFSDDLAGNGSEDNVAAESPVIDLTATHTAGETWVTVTVDYGYRRLNNNEILRFEYWNADTSVWQAWGENIAGNNTSITVDFCTIPKTEFTTPVLNIGNFTANQLSGFRYRIYFDDNVNGVGWVWGFCFDSPTITSELPPCTFAIVESSQLVLDCDNTQFSVEVDIASIGDALHISNGTDTWEVNSTGVTTVGPFSSGSSQTLTVIHSNTICDIPLGTFTYTCLPSGSTCEDPIVVDTIPYSSDSDTAEYGNAYVGADLPSFVGAQYINGTGSASYLSGNDAVYAFTPTEDGSFNFVMTAPTADWYSLWLFEGCTPFSSTVAYHTSTTGATRTLPEIQLVAGTTYYVVISTWAAPQTTPYNLTITQNTCTNATVSYTTVNDCENSGGFMVNVAVTDMGTAANITLSDNQGNDTQAVTEVGNYLFGPYTNGTAVVITVTDDDDANCVQNSASITQVACPPDNITCATAITVNCGETIEGTSVGSTGTAEGIGCNAFGVNGVWYSFTGTGANITVTTTASFDHRMGIAVGDDCGSLTNIVCRDGSTQAETFEIPNTTLGATYYVYIAHYSSGNTTTGTHSITIECAVVPEDVPECATGLVSTMGDCGNSDTTLSWEAVDLAAGYYVTVGTTPGGNDVLDSEDVSGTSVSVSQTASTTYYWTVVPYNVVGSADGCEEMSYTTEDTTCYCTAGGGGTLEKISNVTLINIETSEEVINNNSTSTGNYENFTSVVGNVNRESTYSFTASFTGTSYPNDQVIVWIDYNQDGDFDDEGEQVFMTVTSTSPWSGTIEIPATAEIGLTRMRVRLHDANLGSNITPCGNSNWGQVEDYTLNIGEPLSTGDYNLNSFIYYPNPVNDVLNLSAQNAIQHISVYNMLGQEVLTKQLNVNVTEVDMTGLPSGHYLVRVTSENVTKTVKVVKL